MRTDQSCGGMFAVIPSVVMQDPALSMSARMLYGIITWRCNDKSYCWASNRTLGTVLGLSAKRVSALVSELEAQGHIETEIVKDSETGAVKYRYIYPIVKSSRRVVDPIPKNEDTPPQEQAYPSPNSGGPPPENEEDIYEKYKKNDKEKQKEPPKAPQGAEGRKSKFALQEEAKPLLRAYVGQDSELAWALADFIQLREQLRAVNSAVAIKALLSKLDKLSGGDRAIKLQLIEEAMANSWKSVFPSKGGKARPAAPPDRHVVEREEVPTW